MVKLERFGVEFKVPVDRISMLSSDLLGLIVSLLTTKEAAATSILSRRWRNVWTLSPRLDLDGTEFIERVIKVAGENRYDKSVTEKERREYVRWVDRVVMGCSTVVESLVEFRLFFDLTNKHANHLDGWLHFAVTRKVERLELNLTDRVSRELRRYNECYDFPYRKSNFPDGLKMIKKLFTHNVNVSGDALEFFLGNCPLLEQLTVSGSGHLTSLKIIRTFHSFKCLEISLCHHLDSLVIRDSDLVTLKYSGKRILDFELLNVPLLTQLWIHGRLILNMKDVVEMFSPLLPQLQMFNIYFVCNPSWNETATFLSSSVQMSNLKQLEVTIGGARPNSTILPLINLISASPRLQRFMVEVRSVENEYDKSFDTRKFHRRVYPHLKEVEFVGYRSGDSMFHELVMHFVKNDVALENVVVDPRSSEFSLDHPWERIFRPRVEEETLARAYAKKQLRKYIARAYAKELLRKYIHSRIHVKIL